MKTLNKNIKTIIYINILIYLLLLLLFGSNLYLARSLVMWVIFNVYDVLAFWIVGIIAFVIALSSCIPLEHRKGWELTGIGIFLYGLGDLWWALSTPDVVDLDFLNFMQDWVYLGAALLWTAGFVLLSGDIFNRSKYSLPTRHTTISSLLSILIFIALSLGLYRAQGLDNAPYDYFVNLLYVMIDTILFFISLRGILWAHSLKIKPLRRMWSFIFASATILTVLDTLYGCMTAFFSLNIVALSYLWIFPVFLMGLGAAEYIDYLRFYPTRLS